MNEEKPGIVYEEDQETITDSKLPFKVILYNDDWHTFDEVIVQLIKAIQCNIEDARAFAFEVHVKGLAVVFNGSLQKCLKVSSVLEEIELHTQVVS
jgi:ATP-dependent Clp protease adaptor protein ClpS